MISLVTNKKTQHGMTLLEIMLVLAIASSIIVLSIRSYRQYQQRAYIEQIKYNVDTLFQAMKNYYHAQCASGTLATASTNQSYKVPMDALLPYLPQKWEVKNPYITGYELRFIPNISTPVYINACVVTEPGVPCTPSSTPLPTSQARVIIWKAQVVLQMNMTQETIDVYQKTLGADCVSSDGINCSSTGSYLLWQRLPSAIAVSSSRSIFWLSMPLLKQFNLQYTHDQMLELNEGYSTQQNYLCGG